MLAHLGALDRHLGPNMSQHSPKMTPRCQTNAILETTLSQHRQRQPPRCLSHPFQALQNYQKPKKTSSFSMFFTIWLITPKISKIIQNAFQNGAKLAILSTKSANIAPAWCHPGPSWRQDVLPEPSKPSSRGSPDRIFSHLGAQRVAKRLQDQPHGGIFMNFLRFGIHFLPF